MATVTNRKVLSIERKFKVLREIENKERERQLTCVGNLVSQILPTIQRIWKNRTKISGALERNVSRIVQFRKPERSDIDGGTTQVVSTTGK
jgi:hypothetical protein